MGDTCKWNATVDAFLPTHNPSRLMDFYQIFYQVTEGVNANQNSNPEDVPVGLPIGIVLDQRKRMVGFKQESIWSQFLCYLPSMGNTHTSFISLLSSRVVIKASQITSHCWLLIWELQSASRRIDWISSRIQQATWRLRIYPLRMLWLVRV